MRKEKRILEILMVLGVFLAMAINPAMARPPFPPPFPGKPMGPPLPPHSKIRADLKVTELEVGNCPCKDTLNGVDAMHINWITVHVANDPPQIRMDIPNSIRGPVTTEVKVRFYDLFQGRMVTLTKRVTIPAGSSKNVYFLRGSPRLIRKSTGITAWVEIPSGVVLDSPQNNRKVRKECFVIVY